MVFARKGVFMALSTQFDLFEETGELIEMRKQIEATQKECANVRRGLFARHGELAKMFLQLVDRCDSLEKQLQIVAKNK